MLNILKSDIISFKGKPAQFKNTAIVLKKQNIKVGDSFMKEMKENFNSSNIDSQLQNYIETIYKKMLELPPTMRLAMVNLCSYINGKSNINDFISDFRQSCEYLEQDMKSPKRQIYKNTFKSEFQLINKILQTCRMYEQKNCSKSNLDGSIELSLSSYQGMEQQK